MRKWLMTVTALVLVLALGGSVMAAGRPAASCRGRGGCAFAEAGGVCGRCQCAFVDADGDGICDNCTAGLCRQNGGGPCGGRRHGCRGGGRR